MTRMHFWYSSNNLSRLSGLSKSLSFRLPGSVKKVAIQHRSSKNVVQQRLNWFMVQGRVTTSFRKSVKGRMIKLASLFITLNNLRISKVVMFRIFSDEFFLVPSGSTCSLMKFLKAMLLHSHKSCMNLNKQANTLLYKISYSASSTSYQKLPNLFRELVVASQYSYLSRGCTTNQSVLGPLFIVTSAILEEIFFPSRLMIFSIFRNNSFFLSATTFSNRLFWQVVFPPSRYAMLNYRMLRIRLRSSAFFNVYMTSSATLDYFKNICAYLISCFDD